MRTGQILLNSLEQLRRRKLVVAAGIISGIFLALYAFFCSLVRSNSFGATVPGPDAALAAVFLTLPAAASLCAAFFFILGSSLLPEEISAGRAGFWAALPVSRRSLFAGFTLSCLAVSSAISALLFGGIEAIASAFFPFAPTNLPLSLLAFFAWAGVLWAAVTLLSMLMNRIVAIIVCFCAYGFMNFLGGLSQLAGVIPEGGPGKAFQTAGLISALIFPSDPPFRMMVHGLLPRGAAMEDMMAFTGASAQPPLALTLYAAAWSLGVILLAYYRFSRQDLK
jgi:ABC-type transport system involved in multi-copper enzyme maturation permease subunit